MIARSAVGSDAVLEKARLAMEELRIDVLLLTSPENVTYGSGAAPPTQRRVASRLAAAILPLHGETELVVISVEDGVARDQSRLDRITLYREFVEHPIDVMAAALERRGLGDGRIGIEELDLSVADARRLRERLPRARWAPVDGVLDELRMQKTPDEIELLRQSGRAADRAAREASRLARAGMTEREFATLLDEQFVAAGGDGLVMTVVGSGPRSAQVNAPPTDRRLERGDVLRMDVIGLKSSYYSDVARTAVVGEPSAEQRRVHGVLHEIHERLLAALRPGVDSTSIYAIYRDAMEQAGLPPYHFVGHGLGIGLHEEPFINQYTSIVLREGMVLCIEPITLIENAFGVHIEDQVVITADGCESLSGTDELLRIGE